MNKPTTNKIATFRITYSYKGSGNVVGLNQYKSLHWQKLKKIYDKVKDKLANLVIQQKPPRLKWFEIRVYQNTNYDMDNLVGMVKPFVDILRSKNIVPEDDKKYWDYLAVIYDPTLTKNTIVFEVKGEVLNKIKTK